MRLPTLFKKTRTGADQQWDIGTEGNVIVTKWGQIGGAIQETRDAVQEGKNAGRSNATTPVQQAETEARSRWEHKLKKGYVQDLSSARAGEVDGIIQGGIFPMLAERMDRHGGKLKYPCLSQPKLDGHRCIAMVGLNGRCTLWTRSRKPILSMPHIVAGIERMALRGGTKLDGELYNHDYRDRFEELTSFIRDSSVKPGSDVVQYHVYDVVSSQPQRVRTKWLADQSFASPIMRVMTLEADSEDELMGHFTLYTSMGYEGAMARNMDGLYQENRRSTDLLKIKGSMDDEFEVIGVDEGRGKLAGHAGAFLCKTKAGAEFKAKLVGELSGLRKYFEDPGLAVGRHLTVEYRGLTGKNGVPRFPVALRFRED